MQAEPPKRPELACSDAPWLQALGVAWDYLEDSDSLKAIRACCREARALHARQLSKLVVCMSGLGPSYPELACGLRCLRELGARFKQLELDFDLTWTWFYDPELGPAPEDGRREQQIVATLEACRGPGAPSMIKLGGEFSVTRRMCEALASLQPASLNLHCRDMRSVLPKAGPVLDRAVHWAGELLRRCLPQLESLTFTTSPAFPPLLVLSLCHATTKLRSLDMTLLENTASVSAMEATQSALETIIEVRGLQSLKLTNYVDPVLRDDGEIAALLDLRCLSALSGLTSLSLDMMLLKGEESLRRSSATEEQLARMRPAWREQRAGLVAALREMRGLAELSLCYTELEAPDLPQLTALTSLRVYDIRLPAGHETGALEVPGAGGTRMWPLAPRLEVLDVVNGMSPSLASSLAAPPSLRSFGDSVVICFDHKDIMAEAQDGQAARFRLRPEACAAVATAVGFIKSVDPDVGSLRLTAACPRDKQLLPPSGAADAGGHAAWLSALAPLPVEELSVDGFALEVLDLIALVDTMPWLTQVDLAWAYVPWAAMPVLSRLESLSTLALPAYGRGGGAEFGASQQHLAKSILLQLMLTASSLEYLRVYPRGPSRGLLVAVAGEVQSVLDAREVGARIEVIGF